MSVTRSSVLHRSPDVTWTELDGEIALLHLDTGHVSVLNATGALIWQCLDGVGDVDALVDDLTAATGTPRTRIESDVLALLQELHDQGCVVEQDPIQR